MGNLFSAFGFNQPFLIALAVIAIMLLVTARLVGNDEPQKSNTTHRRSDTTVRTLFPFISIIAAMCYNS
ncbi:hypothetical protein X798_04463 [Onchocerca flexuosa]|uniref:Uncharacterized protein n=1 Tax=Onchocerca flexuosa TaxID=387005 RepID=A0A238BT46_9BILA|nr:hypothetical protein X798_04463 [Onchocerca flexuosa]